MKFTIEQITDSRAEEVLVKCCDSQAAWVEKDNITSVIAGDNTSATGTSLAILVRCGRRSCICHIYPDWKSILAYS